MCCIKVFTRGRKSNEIFSSFFSPSQSQSLSTTFLLFFVHSILISYKERGSTADKSASSAARIREEEPVLVAWKVDACWLALPYDYSNDGERASWVMPRLKVKRRKAVAIRLDGKPVSLSLSTSLSLSLFIRSITNYCEWTDQETFGEKPSSQGEERGSNGEINGHYRRVLANSRCLWKTIRDWLCLRWWRGGGGEGKGRTLSSQHFSTFCWRSLLFYNSTATCSVRRGPDVSPREKERKGSVLPASLILLMAARPVRFIQHLVREKLSHRTMASCRVLRWIIHTHTATSFFSLLHFFLCCPFRPLLFLFPCPPPQNLLPLLFPYIQARARRTQLTSHDQSLPVTSGY